ncbi:MAG: endonuclease/exonuclease/phosphatase family protein [Phycisphaerae bacterium]|nr:endonuclease/exonuclease/phosphatase family protein [Phycisphaerae bacterium]
MFNHFVAFWNLENLFAPEGFAQREPWIAQQMASDLSGWTQALFEIKIDQLVSIIRQMNGHQGPDILGVCEAENAFVLEQLTARLNGQINSRTYAVAHVDSTLDFRGIDTAFVYDASRYEVDPNAIFSHFVMRRTGTRDITQITLTTPGGSELIVLCNHWPSRSGGAYESRGYRMTAGETLSYWHQRIWEEKGNTQPIIAMGDFNDDPFDESIQIHARATRERGDVERVQTAVRFYNLAWHYLEQQGQDCQGNPKHLHGTLYHQGDGYVFDQLFVSKGLVMRSSPITVLEDTARIEMFPEMVDHRVSQGPKRFGLPKGNASQNVETDGFSDHFPVSVVIQEQ